MTVALVLLTGSYLIYTTDLTKDLYFSLTIAAFYGQFYILCTVGQAVVLQSMVHT